jgi:hypothetical protein
MHIVVLGALACLSLAATPATAHTCPYDPRCINNPYGAGSPYDPDSVNNPYGRYGSPYSPDSPNNPYGAGNPYGQPLAIVPQGDPN